MFICMSTPASSKSVPEHASFLSCIPIFLVRPFLCIFVYPWNVDLCLIVTIYNTTNYILCIDISTPPLNSGYSLKYASNPW